MKSKLFAIAMLGFVAAMPLSGILATPQQGTGPTCTKYGCIELEWMANRFYANGGWNNGCTKFEDATTGRKVRSRTGPQGGEPVIEPGSQLVWATTSQDCSTCSSPMTPPSQDSAAVLGTAIAGNVPVPFTWEKWICDPDKSIADEEDPIGAP